MLQKWKMMYTNEKKTFLDNPNFHLTTAHDQN